MTDTAFEHPASRAVNIDKGLYELAAVDSLDGILNLFFVFTCLPAVGGLGPVEPFFSRDNQVGSSFPQWFSAAVDVTVFFSTVICFPDGVRRNVFAISLESMYSLCCGGKVWSEGNCMVRLWPAFTRGVFVSTHIS